MDKHHTPLANGLLLGAAIIWGFGFVAQRLGMEHLGPYTFNGLRFILGALSLLPLIWWFSRKSGLELSLPLLIGGIATGSLLFIAASLQQVGLQYTTVANAGFITGFYLILVPILGLIIKHKTGLNTWIGAILTLVGLYFLSIKANFSIGYGDLLQLIGALFWAIHLLTIDHYSHRVNPIQLASLQFFVCSLLSFTVAFATEQPTLAGIQASWAALLYSGLMSVGLAYTLQVVGQRYAHPSHAAIILSLEAVFAALGGVLFLNEYLDQRALLGCGLMLTGMLISQLPMPKLKRADV
ncbi:DMT family transporter [Thiofilum flexile]|uniref:DMT family transporter n=1 Tax=Thiofilum flexile TaxID=125627 RepID=UPI00037D8791|nr:DMT family transporter [Thiofilum flexile]